MKDRLTRRFAAAQAKAEQKNTRTDAINAEVTKFSEATESLHSDIEKWLAEAEVAAQFRRHYYQVNDSIWGEPIDYPLEALTISVLGNELEVLPLSWKGAPAGSLGIVTIGVPLDPEPHFVSLGDMNGWGNRRHWSHHRNHLTLEQADAFTREVFYALVDTKLVPEA
ncbi:hypothetical protein N7414_23025 [Pseudomonas sp. GD04087]|uniref:hypothetical protein n=1 Tax=unclassified Pseudomonas TaxID=196821 RepID=UPI002449CA9E|nr:MULTISPECIES: hypothetical protein [unclassified Pseudomonas]MDH0292008.1 hypothetical protein [Pseudomonas sp. GD04087]MDH1052856.1 hypothetical protein [Pseudomonas sp. GD03903]MDH2002019.1 hypothetical protein [Pseudomonas sp. GD03691]